jgi:DDE superfamily endonuclease
VTIAVLVPFAPLFSRPVWVHVPVLVAGARLCRGPCTVAAVLRVVGLGEERRFTRYHRVLSRARGSGLLAAKILLGWLLAVLPESGTPILPIDETLERRQGRRIKAKGDYRDAVRSTPQQVVKCLGLKWIRIKGLLMIGTVPAQVAKGRPPRYQQQPFQQMTQKMHLGRVGSAQLCAYTFSQSHGSPQARSLSDLISNILILIAF